MEHKEQEGEEGKGEDAPLEMIGRRRRFYTSAEVALHNCARDCWVSKFGKVYDLSALVGGIAQDSADHELTLAIVAHAGTDVSDWFDKATGEVKRARDDRTGLDLPVLPHGRFLHVAPSEPVCWATDFDSPWWRDSQYCIGRISTSVRKVNIVNMLTYQETTLEVCEEESLLEVQERYEDWNAHSSSYTWKVLDNDVFRPLDMKLTLSDNGVPDESALFDRLSMEHEIPTIHAYFNDDLTEA